MALFKINEAEFSFLSRYVKSEQFSVILKEAESATFDDAIKKKSVYYEIELSHDQSSRLVDLLSDLLVEKGLDDNGEPNSLGLQIESIIDVFNSVSD